MSNPYDSQFDFFLSEAEREKAMARLESHNKNFIADGLQAIARLPKGHRMTGEDIRRILSGHGLSPNHPNAWGLLIRHATRKKLIYFTGEYGKMRAVKSHARRTPVYMKS